MGLIPLDFLQKLLGEELLSLLSSASSTIKSSRVNSYKRNYILCQLLFKIFVRESGSEKYLIFKSGENEEAWKIVDDNTLVTGENTIASVTLKRIDSKK